MKKALVISWYFPPVNSSEGLVTFKLLKNSKYKYDVFTQKGNLSWTYGAREEKLVSSNITPIFSKSSNLQEWVKEGVEYFLSNKDKYEYIMSRSMAPESHMIAYEIKKKYPNIKWIASFGDPIYDNPFSSFYKETSPYSAKGVETGNCSVKYFMSPKRILKNMIWHIRHKRYMLTSHPEVKNKQIQMSTLKNCDLVILNNEYQKKHMISTCPFDIEDKIVVLPHSFDLDFYPKVNDNTEKGKIKFAYLGHLDEIRTPINFLKALVKLKETYPKLVEKMIIEFYGNLSDKDKVFIMDNQLYDFVKVNKSVDYFESLKIMSNSDWLLSFDANLGEIIPNNIFFPAKLADYLGSGTKIFAVTMLDGASADVLRETGAIIASHSVSDIYTHLLSILEGKLSSDIHDTGRYNSRNVAKEYDKLIEERIL